MGEQKNAPVQDINQLLKVRREKLAELQEAGKDPFTITKYDVTHHSQEIKDQFDRAGRTERFHRRTYDVQACHGKSIFLQHSGSERKHSVLCCQRQRRRRSVQGISRRWISAIS